MGSTLLSASQESAWGARRSEIAQHGEVAGLFRGWKPAGFDESSVRILYVGKATSGTFHEQDVEASAFNGKGAFWGFAREIGKHFNCHAELTCLAWTNISKISRPQIAADASVLHDFEPQAIETLKEEISLTQPDVVVFVTGHFGEQVLRAVAEGIEDVDWIKSEEIKSYNKVSDVWWRTRSDGVSVLWMRHPQGASSELREYAAQVIVTLA